MTGGLLEHHYRSVCLSVCLCVYLTTFLRFTLTLPRVAANCLSQESPHCLGSLLRKCAGLPEYIYVYCIYIYLHLERDIYSHRGEKGLRVGGGEEVTR